MAAGYFRGHLGLIGAGLPATAAQPSPPTPAPPAASSESAAPASPTAKAPDTPPAVSPPTTVEEARPAPPFPVGPIPALPKAGEELVDRRTERSKTFATDKVGQFRRVEPGRGTGLSPSPSPRPALRTRRATLTAPGSPPDPSKRCSGVRLRSTLGVLMHAFGSAVFTVGSCHIDPLSLPGCPPSPCARLSRAPTTTRTPPRPGANSRRRACPPPGGGEGSARTVPTFTTNRSVSEVASCAPAASP